VTFTGKAFRVQGTVTPFVAGQTVRIRVTRGKQIVSAKTKRIVSTSSGAGGLFRAEFRTKVPGKLKVRVTHDANDAMTANKVKSDPVFVIRRHLAPGDVGYSVKVMQILLKDLGYVPGRYGVFDDRTARAIIAFRKVSGLDRITYASQTVLRRMYNGGGVFHVRYPELGHHVEADIGNQVMALIDNGKPQRIYHISSGAPATPTVLGRWRVYMKTPGTNAKGMVHSSYFTGGYAIHGYASVPTYNASHGCLRVPVPDAWSIYNWVQTGDWVATYYRQPGEGKGRDKRIKNPGP
jgi:lipoprotein-anchoring transpeptidase ErfK/SrfK